MIIGRLDAIALGAEQLQHTEQDLRNGNFHGRGVFQYADALRRDEPQACCAGSGLELDARAHGHSAVQERGQQHHQQDEHLFEQALEGRRFYDIARWAAADVLLVGWTPQGALYIGSNLPTLRENYQELVYDQASGNNLFLTGSATDAKRYIVPIPPSTMASGYKFNLDRDYLLPFQQRLLTLTDNNWKQNPGW